MGIHGLLPLLKSIMAPIHVKDLRGCTVAVDTYSWLHKGALSCSKELCSAHPTSRHIDYCMHRVNMLLHHGVKPVLIFDGGLLPMKSDQEAKRSRTRKENLERALEHESAGNHAAAYECYQKAVDISPSIAFELIQVLRQVNVDYIVAPYEADAQLTYLSIHNLVDAVITEDSDLIPFGCSRIIFKMDKFGQGVEFHYSNLPRNKDLNFTGFNKQMLLEMCIFSGCDYLQSLPGMGLKRAHALVHKFKHYDKVIKHLKYSAVTVPSSYEENFKKALWTFQYQRVYDLSKDDIVHLSEVPHDIECDLDFLGPLMPQSVVRGIAKGDLDPFTKLPFKGGSIPTRSYIVKDINNKTERKKVDLPAQKNVVTNYFCLASLDAKRKFKAPRLLKDDSLKEPSPEARDHISDFSCLTEEDSPSTMNSPQGSPINPIVRKDDLPQKSSMEAGLDHFLFQHSKHGDKFKPPVAVHSDGKIITVKRKVIVRSSYFQPKLLDGSENDSVEYKGSIIEKNEAIDVLSDSIMAENTSLTRNKHLKSALRKRKSMPSEAKSIPVEASNAKQFQENGVLSTTVPDVGSKLVESDTEKGNFGCDISHLCNYSDVAEKSMERFVSVISSFKCVTTGSRASGLRAPLKDLQNTCSARSSTVAMDLRKFSYGRGKQKITSTSHQLGRHDI